MATCVLCSRRGSRPVPCCPLSWHVSGEATGALEDAEKPPRLGRLSMHPDPGRFRRRLRSEFRSVNPGGKRCVGGPAHGWVASVRTHPRLPAVSVRSTHRVESVILLASEARNDRTLTEAGTGLTEGAVSVPCPRCALRDRFRWGARSLPPPPGVGPLISEPGFPSSPGRTAYDPNPGPRRRPRRV